MTETSLPEFSRPVVVESLGSGMTRLTIVANESERAALAHRFDLQSLDRLEAKVTLKPINRGALIQVSGQLHADVLQSCVVTLEPVASRIDETFDLTYGFQTDIDAEEVELTLDLSGDEDDPPEPIEGGVIDIGEAVAEQLALAIEPFPRKQGAVFIPPQEPEPVDAAIKSPFETLVRFTKKEK